MAQEEISERVRHGERRVELSRGRSGPDSRETVAALSQLADCYLTEGRLDAARGCLVEALAALRGSVELHVALLETQAKLSETKGEWARSVDLRERALHHRRALFDGSEDRGILLAFAQSSLGEALKRSREHAGTGETP